MRVLRFVEQIAALVLASLCSLKISYLSDRITTFHSGTPGLNFPYHLNRRQNSSRSPSHGPVTGII